MGREYMLWSISDSSHNTVCAFVFESCLGRHARDTTLFAMQEIRAAAGLATHLVQGDDEGRLAGLQQVNALNRLLLQAMH